MISKSTVLKKIERVGEGLIFSIIALFIYAPIIVLILFSFNSSSSTTTFTGFSLRWYKYFFQSSETLHVLLNSLLIASITTTLTITMSLLYCLGARFSKIDWLTNIISLNSLVPEIVIAACILAFFLFCGLPIGFLSIICGHTILGLGISVPIIVSSVKAIDKEIIEAAIDLGSSEYQILRHIIIPLIKPAIISSCFITFTLSLDDFFIAFFNSGSSVHTISTYVYAKIRASSDPTLNVLSSILFFISLAMVIFISRRSDADETIIYE